MTARKSDVESIPSADGQALPASACSANPFQKWKWMMDYCRERRWHPSDFWDVAQKAWQEKFEPKR